MGCEIVDQKKKVVAFAVRVGNLYYLEYIRKEQVNVTGFENKERLWHRSYRYLGEQNLRKMEMTEKFDYDKKKNISFCETYVGGKHHRSPFEKKKKVTTSAELLELVHTDICVKMGEKSYRGAEYFVTFIDDHSQYAWVYPLKTKHQVYEEFQKWKIQVEQSSGRKLKRLRSDNGGEYTSTVFKNYLESEGNQHEKTIPKTPQQNGVAERLNRTLLEMSRSMLIDAKLSKKYWAKSVSTAVYLKKTVSTKAVKDKTPYEAWYGRSTEWIT